MAASETSHLAVLVDADNAKASAIAEILGEVARYGTATVKRAYGDWTTPAGATTEVPRVSSTCG